MLAQCFEDAEAELWVCSSSDSTNYPNTTKAKNHLLLFLATGQHLWRLFPSLSVRMKSLLPLSRLTTPQGWAKTALGREEPEDTQ